MNAPTSLRLSPDVLHRCHERSAGRHLARFAVFVLIYFGSAAGAITVATQATSLWPFILNLPLYLLAAASLHGISLFTHEAVHGTLAENHALNATLGSLCALPVLQNFSAYRVLHLDHHQH
jgi:fatty acid desaturase